MVEITDGASPYPKNIPNITMRNTSTSQLTPSSRPRLLSNLDQINVLYVKQVCTQRSVQIHEADFIIKNKK